MISYYKALASSHIVINLFVNHSFMMKLHQIKIVVSSTNDEINLFENDIFVIYSLVFIKETSL